MDTVRNIPGAAPMLPGNAAAAGAVPEAPAVNAAPPAAAAPAIQGDQGNAAAAVNWELPDVNVENIDINEFKALDGMMQHFMADGKLTAQEWEVYSKTRTFYAEGEAHPPQPEPHPAPPTGGGAPPVESHPPAEPAAPPSAWEHGNEPVKGTKFSSVGDPHETTGDGLKFDNMKVGDFVKLQSASGDFMLQTRQEPWSKNPKATVNTMAAVKSGNDTVVFDGKANTVTINGQARQLKEGETIQLPGGGSVKGTKDGVEITTAKGDSVKVVDRGEYIDVTGEVSASRKDGEIRGSLGEVDSDTVTTGDLLGRNGKKDFGQDYDAFIEEWRAKPGESLLPGDPPGSGAREEMEMRAKAEDEALFRNLDITKDGWLSGTETRGFEKYDLDGNGELTKEEFMSARETERIAERDFMLRDINNDGYLSGNEIPPDLRKYDKDGNGRLTKEEYIAGRLAERKLGGGNNGGPVGGGGNNKPADPFAGVWTKWFELRFDKKDKDGDGELERGEVSRRLIRRYDKDGDGELSKKEFIEGKKADHERAFNRRDKNGDGVLEGRELRGIKRRDKNGDGKVTKEEFMQGVAEDRERRMRAQLERRFNRLDENNDNALTGRWHVRKFDENGDGKVSKQEYLDAHLKPDAKQDK